MVVDSGISERPTTVNPTPYDRHDPNTGKPVHNFHPITGEALTDAPTVPMTAIPRQPNAHGTNSDQDAQTKPMPTVHTRAAKPDLNWGGQKVKLPTQ